MRGSIAARTWKFAAWLSCAALAACGGGAGGDAGSGAGGDGRSTAPPPLPAPVPAVPFADVTQASNIAYEFGITTPASAGPAREVGISTLGGVAAGDCDGDTDIDLFITYGDDKHGNGPGGPNRLYLNQLVEQGDGLRFLDSAVAAGVANTRTDGQGNDRHSGPAFADMDGDGDLDLFVGGLYGDPSKIYANQGDCTFMDVSPNSPDIEAVTQAGARQVHTISAGFGDYDLDGDLDMFLTHWGTRDEIYDLDGDRNPDIETDHLWRNRFVEDGVIRFVNVSESSGISDMAFATRDYLYSEQAGDFTFTPTFAHLNDDLWPDIAITGDFGTSQVALNDGDGTFTNLGNTVLREAQYGMGSALGDVDNDGDLDWFVSSILGPGDNTATPQGNRFFTNVGGAGLFEDQTLAMGVPNGGWGWGACFLDVDNDTDLDIFHTNGWRDEFLGAEAGFYADDRSRAFVMNANGVYADSADDLGLDGNLSGRGVVCADFDHDGDIDIFEHTDAAGNSGRLLENRSAAAGNNSLRIRLEGLAPNTEAAGARIFLTLGSTEYMREISIGSNFTSQNPTIQVFGLGSASRADALRVEWPALSSPTGPVQPPDTLIEDLADPRLVASALGDTLILRHPDLPPP